jgi:hypothetical protein
MKEQGERFHGWRKSIVKLVEMDEKITLRANGRRKRWSCDSDQ